MSTLAHVRQGYLSGRKRMAMTRPLEWNAQALSDVESGMRMAAIMHASGRSLPDWPDGVRDWPPDLLRRWIEVCLDHRLSELLDYWPTARRAAA